MSRARSFSAHALVLGGIAYGESDRIVTFLTRERGRLGAFAAGARRSKKRFGGALEPFTLLQVELSEGRGDLYSLTSCTILDSFGGLQADLGRLGHAGHAAELCRELCRDRVAHEELFDALREYLGRLSSREACPLQLLAFELAALGHVGVAPRFTDCAVCGSAELGRALFDPAHGGALCSACAFQAFPGAARADPDALALAATLQAEGPWGGATCDDPALRARTRALVRRFTRQTLGHLPRSLDFLSQVGIEG